MSRPPFAPFQRYCSRFDLCSLFRLALCDLAGSERCSRTHNTGARLKEAGNINSSLLTLGKCINAMKLNQNAKYDPSILCCSDVTALQHSSFSLMFPCRFQHHIPFRESKLTHFLQFFFCVSGRVSMVVNINQNSSCFDETLNVLKFSALAQKVPLPLLHTPFIQYKQVAVICNLSYDLIRILYNNTTASNNKNARHSITIPCCGTKVMFRGMTLHQNN